MIRCDHIFITGARRVHRLHSQILQNLFAPYRNATLYHSGCRWYSDTPSDPYRGVDGVAHGCWPPDQVVAMEADRDQYGIGAGLIRNGEMRAVAAELRSRGDRVLFAAFPGEKSRDVRDCIERFAGFPMIVIPLDQLC